MFKKGIYIAVFATLFVACDPQSNCETECGNFCGGFCGETGSSIGGFFGHVWDVLLGNCTEICQVKVKFVNENGGAFTRICEERVSMKVSIKLADGSTQTVVDDFDVELNSSGETGFISINCIDMADLPGVMIVQPAAVSASFIANDPTCGPEGALCRGFGLSAVQSTLDFDKANCALVVIVKMGGIGPCISCPC